MDITDIYKTFHQNSKVYMILSSVPHGTFSKIEHSRKLNNALYLFIPPQMKFNINIRYRKLTNSQKLKTSQLKNHPVNNKETKKTTKDLLELNENDENITFSNLWDIMKMLLRGNFIAASAFINILEKINTSDLAHEKALEQKKQTHPSRVDSRKYSN